MTFYEVKEWQNGYLHEHEKSKMNNILFSGDERKSYSSFVIEKYWKQQKGDQQVHVKYLLVQ